MVRRVLYLLAFCSAVACSQPTDLVAAEATKPEAKSAAGLKPGDPIGAFRVVKVAGAVDDDVEPGDTLCYRCRYGSSPMVMVFARESSKELDKLTKTLEASVEKHKENKLHAFVTMLGGELSKLKEDAESLAKRTSVKLMPIVVAEDVMTGPIEYQLSPSDDVTVVIAQDSQVFATAKFAAAKINSASIEKQIESMLSE